ncbi:tripartite tricarboxylate transporter TctB family protein [Dongia sp.]|uniref:tripartite tricarboxylate transporter TctB family protein n=1 Tax=Dongia sp. TaxID=1977262 RepID=UPI0035AE4B00
MTVAKNDLVVGVVLIALAVVYWLGADTIPKSLLEGGIGADALPKMLGVALGILSLLLVLQSALGPRSKAGDGTEKAAPRHGIGGHKYALGMLCIGVGYVALVETIGYALGIAYLLAAVVLLVGGASRRIVIAFAVIGAVLFWAFFVGVLEIRQPKGFWPDLWNSMQAAPSQAQSALTLSSAHPATPAS